MRSSQSPSPLRRGGAGRTRRPRRVARHGRDHPGHRSRHAARGDREPADPVDRHLPLRLGRARASGRHQPVSVRPGRPSPHLSARRADLSLHQPGRLRGDDLPAHRPGLLLSGHAGLREPAVDQARARRGRGRHRRRDPRASCPDRPAGEPPRGLCVAPAARLRDRRAGPRRRADARPDDGRHLGGAGEGRPVAGAVLVTLGALAKPFALLALPALWRPWNWRMVLAAR